MKIYLCPRGEAAKILADHLPQEHSGSLTVNETSIIGLVVWRRPHVSPKVPPNRQDVPKSRATVSSSVVPRISKPSSRSSNACRSHQDVPRFGPGVVKDDHDLPKHNCVSTSNSASNATASTNRSPRLTSLSEFRTREMIRKYGKESVADQHSKGDGDEFASMFRKDGNVPEWYPNSQSNLQQMQIPQAQCPYQQQRQYHPMFQHHTTREYQSYLPQAYVQHQDTYGNLMPRAQQSYHGVPDGVVGYHSGS